MQIQLQQGEVLEELFADKKIIQNTELYRFTSDSIILSRFVKGKKNDTVADFCAGSGIVGLHFACLNTHIGSVTLFEMQQSLSEMSARTIAYNGFTNVNAVCCRVQDIGTEYNGAFSLVLCNPPYERGGFENLSYEKAVCRKEITITLKEIVDTAARVLKYGGRFAVINRADRAAELIYLLKQKKLEPKRMQFVSGKSGVKPYLVMVEAVYGGKEGVDVLPTLINSDKCGICGG
ncbi:MAG: methyltransferase [Clostridia bacterium]|nr:methyltransferase [Clostridia bacterium]